MPVEQHEVLDPIAAVQESEGSGSESADEAAEEEEAREMDHSEDRTQEAPPAVHHTAKAAPETFRKTKVSPHEQQMDDLFGDMRKQQADEEAVERQHQKDQERFTDKSRGTASRLGEDLGESNDLGEGAGVGATVGASAPQAATPSLASPGRKLIPGKDEVQSHTTGHIKEELQVGSSNGLLADATHAFTKAGKVPQGRIAVFGKKSGLYLHNSDTTWSMFSDADKESGGVCLKTAYNNEPKGIKVCHTDKTTGKWASGNVGITGDLMFEGKSTRLDVQRLHLTTPNIGPAGYVLKLGSAGPSLAAGVDKKSAWLQVSERKPLVLNPGKGNVGFGTETPMDKMHVAGNMAIRNLYLAHTKPIFTPNRLTLKSGAGWYMNDKLWMRAIDNKGIEAQAGAYFSDKVGVNFDWKAKPSKAKVRINDGKIAVTRKIGSSLKGVAYFYDDTLGEGRVYARDFTKKKWAPMRWEADAIIFSPNGKSPVAIGTRTPKAKYLLHIHGNNKIDGHIYVAKKMKVGGRAHVQNLHTPRLNVKDQRGRDGSGQRPADGVQEFVIGETHLVGVGHKKTYELKPGGTNLRLGYWKRYCWMQMWPKGPRGSALVLNGAGNRVGFGTTRPKTNIPGSGSQLLFHVDGNMLVTGNLVVKGEVSGQSTLETETLLDVGASQTVDALHHLKSVAPKEGTSAHFGDSAAHKEAISLSHIGATLTRSLQHHDSLLEENRAQMAKHTERISALETKLASFGK